MELLTEIVEGNPSSGDTAYRVRRAARAVISDGQGRIALMHVANRGYFKLPGGGMEPGESMEEALRREVLEETGCRIVIGKPVGVIVEERHSNAVLQISYCFLAELDGESGDTELTADEAEAGFRLEWLPWSEATAMIDANYQQDSSVRCIVARDGVFVRKARAVSTD